MPPGEAAALTQLLGLGAGNLLSQYGQYLDQTGLHCDFGLSITEFPTPVATWCAPA